MSACKRLYSIWILVYRLLHIMKLVPSFFIFKKTRLVHSIGSFHKMFKKKDHGRLCDIALHPILLIHHNHHSLLIL